MNKNQRLQEQIAEEVRRIVAGAPPEQEKRSRYVLDQITMLEDTGLHHADRREIDDEVRKRLKVEL
jgi:hypothetical protein